MAHTWGVSTRDHSIEPENRRVARLDRRIARKNRGVARLDFVAVQ